MLIEFSVKNFMSFKDWTTLSMVAGKGNESKETERNVTRAAQGSKYDLKKSAVIFGANASGKTNLYRAHIFFKWFVVLSATTEKPIISHVPFKLDSSTFSQPTEFEIVFLLEGIKYVYGFSVTETHVLNEYLFNYPKKQPRKVFSREYLPEENEYKFKKGEGWESSESEWESIKKATKPHVLMLSIANFLNEKIGVALLEYLGSKQKSIGNDPVLSSEMEYTKQRALKDPDFKAWAIELLRHADVGIHDFEVKEEEKDPEPSPMEPGRVKQEKKTTILFYHNQKSEKGETLRISFEQLEESHGTQKLFALAAPIYYVLEQGSLLIADELDTRMHPLMTRWLLDLFHNPKTNPKGAQIIFTAHDDGLLDSKLFRRDQILFTEKGSDGVSELFALSDLKGVRKAEDIRKGYRVGRYGAVPFLEPMGDED